MENIELQELWKGVGTNMPQKSKKELDLLLTSKAKGVLNRFITLYATSGLTGCALIIYLFIVTVNRKTDTLFLLSNLMLTVLLAWTVIYRVFIYRYLKAALREQSLKEWLHAKIEVLQKLLNPKRKGLSYILTVLVSILIYIAVEIPLLKTTYIEFFSSKETLGASVIGILIGFLVAYFVGKKIKGYQMKNLEFLTDLYDRLTKFQSKEK